MELNNMHSTPGSRHPKKRKGRGDKTAGRGENGQKSRSGFKNKIGFEGGQNPLYKRIPKRGFNSLNTEKVTIISLEKLVALNIIEITPEILIEKNLIKNNYGKLKILGNTEVTTKLNVQANAFSAAAKEAIVNAGGFAKIISNDKK
ncbi:MAG: 50S ribosomal protein L15 [Candidatus Hepatoplasma vulgare]|nr:MAG: 50S ribosomal protein L15 [Candidatus Hepatoplasma sp.]